MGLTDKEVKNARPKDKPYKLTDDRGLYILIRPTGGKSFQYDYRFADK